MYTHCKYGGDGPLACIHFQFMQLSNKVVSSLGFDVCHVIAFFVSSLYERVVWNMTIELQLSSPGVQGYRYWTHESLWIM